MLLSLVFFLYSSIFCNVVYDNYFYFPAHLLMFDSVEGLVLTILSWLIILIFGGSVYGFFRSIFLFIFSWGDPDKIKQAWNGIRFMILWIFLTLLFLFIFPILFKKLEVPGYEAYTAQNIFKFTSSFLWNILDFGKEIGTSGFQPGPTGAGAGLSPTPSWSTQPIEL